MDFSEQYLTYNEYTNIGGTLGQTPFNVLEFGARKEIDKYTFGRLKDLDEQEDEVKMCMFELINTLEGYNADITRNKEVASESTDGYSISYKAPSPTDSLSKENDLKGVIERYLSDCVLPNGTPYLYRGTK